MTSGVDDDQPRFVIEKQVKYNLLRGVDMKGKHRIVGEFLKAKSGDTILQYAVSGDSSAAIFQAVVAVLSLLVITVPLGAFIVNSAGGSIITLPLVVLVATIILYGWFVYRRYQGQLRELHQFMADFAARMGASPKT